MVRELYYNPEDDWFYEARIFPMWVPHQFVMSDEGFGLFETWLDTKIGDDHDVSGVLADWWEEHMPPTPESVRFVAKLREWFHSRAEVGT